MARHLVAALLRSGEWRVRVTDLAPAITLDPVEEKGLLGAALRDGRAVYAPANVCDIAQLTQAFQGVDVVFHTASADPDINDFQLHYKVNVEGTKNVIDACVTCKVQRLIYTSSSAVVFDGIHGLFDVDESMPYPNKFPDAYARSKAEAENLVMKANDIYDLLTCSIRPGSIFGPGDTIVPYLLSHGGMMFTVGDGLSCDDFVYVENVVHGHICAEKTLSTKEGSKISGGKAYFITNMEPMKLWDFIYMLLEELGYKRKFRIRIPLAVIRPITYLIEWSYNKVLHMYGMRQPKILTSARLKYISLNRTFNCKRAVEQLGYKPIVSIKDGIKITTNNAIAPKI
uniref:3-beta hydroxysteroid dehydrogenase/isomerase domain-containing protein n=1 Tax=Oryza punctata TaxID=4537 RepID=A0A0E0KEV2_ORYPU